MREFKFNNLGTFSEFGCVLKPGYTIGEPLAKTNYVSIPGCNSALDLSEVLAGEILYDNREFNASLMILPTWTNRYEMVTKLRNYLHGKRMKMQDPDDPKSYYLGRFSVGAIEQDGKIWSLSISGNLEPYKYRNEVTIKSYKMATSTLDIVLKNSRKKVIPSITVSATTQLIFAGITVSLTAGTYRNSNIFLSEGDNPITIKAPVNTTIKFEYQEGDL
jgi:hypothetical protein